jgi:EmrB/QacA subfamily drug resistance transporter
MAGIDSRILIVGLPQVTAALSASAEQAIWFTQAYALGGTIVMLLIGRLADMSGRVKIFVIGFVIFTISSLLTSVSMDPTQVIIFRAVQGLGSGILQVNSVTIIVDATPSNELGFLLSVNMSAFAFGAVFGLTVSGIILSFLDWRALFYINVPIGIFGTLWARRRLKETTILEKGAQIDWIGFITFTISITSFLLALTLAGYGLSEVTLVYALLIMGAVTLAAFTVQETRIAHPLLDLRLLKIREFTGGIIAQMLTMMAFGAVMLLISLYFQLVVGYSPFEAGIRIIPLELTVLPFMILSGRLSDRFGVLPFTTGGLACTSVALVMLSTVNASTPYLNMVAYMIVSGAGIGLFGSPNMSSIMGAVPRERRGVASALRTVIGGVAMTMSLNVAVLIMTFTLPLSLISQIIASTNAAYISEADILLFVQGLRSTYLWLAVLNAIAIIPSVLRGKRVSQHQLSPGEITPALS